MLRFILLFFTIFYSSLGLAQSKDTLFRLSKKPKPPVDSNFIHSYREYLTIGIFTASPINTMYFSPRRGDSLDKYTTTLTANISNSIGFTAAFRSIYVAVGFRTPLDPESKESKGNTISNSLGIRFNNPKFLISADYRKIKGYFNELEYHKTPDDKTIYAINGGLEQKLYSIRGIYNFNWKKYSLLAPLNYTQRQIKSKVGLLFNAGIFRNSIQSDTTLSQSSSHAQYITFENAYKLNYTSIKLGPGAGFNIVAIKRFYLSFMMFLSIDNVFYSIYSNDNLLEKKYTMSMYFDGRASLGYQSKRFYLAFKYIGDRIVFFTNDMKYENSLGIVTLDFGYRFNAPGFIKKGYDATLTRYLGM
ncbi:MAG: DUF4421 family protein [Cytophagaceae bacterium]